ncbi:MAG: hypothetical protein LBQ54_00920 [Planctomycetaceae bacterium]|jgi:hypothetical protein|nr:hypothetical protein [Planctomycetaceae bacterium]
MNVKIWFDKQLVLACEKRVMSKVLTMYGADTMRLARRMIKKGRKNPTEEDRSLPGLPPHSPTGIYKKLILYGVSEDKRNVFVGPLQFEGNSQGAKALEYGGKTTLTIRPYRPEKPKSKRPRKK